MRCRLLCLLLVAAPLLPALAQEPAPPALPSPEERRLLEAKRRALAERLAALRGRDDPRIADAAVFLHIAEMAEAERLYGSPRDVAAVLRGLDLGLERAALLQRGEAPWTRRPGRTLRGFVSAIDGSVQPYGVVLPAGYAPDARRAWRLDVVLHGRGPTEVSFLREQEPAPGSAAAGPPDQPFIELHPFGRGNNGWRWAGETDVFEALAATLRQYPIERDRIMLRGFSMGGHGAWHLGVHFPSLWAAVSPGAGFAETRRYLKIAGAVPEYQERAWHIYDAVDYALNLFGAPFIAYGGEKDPQLQAALEMKAAAEREGVPLRVLVGPNTEHRYHPESFREIMAFLDRQKRDPRPLEVRFTTWTLKYPRSAWVTIDGMEAHYRRATVLADARSGVTVRTAGVTALTLDPLPVEAHEVTVDGQKLAIEPGRPVRLERREGKWRLRAGERVGGKGELRKRHGLQGPIDDAFTGPFLVVIGTGTPWNPRTQAWAEAAVERFRAEWRFGFRGALPVRRDREVTEEEIRGKHLVLFGDPGSNRLLARIAPRLPIRWEREGLRFAGPAPLRRQRFGPEHVPVLVYPNPLNPNRYVVVNSGHTWTLRELQASNATLTPKLPDWAVLRPTEAGGAEVAAAGFFDERWRLQAEGASSK